MAFSVQDRRSEISEINITPLVDVMLVLLIIFMVSAPMLTRPLPLELPQPGRQNANTLKPPQLQLTIAEDGSYRLDGRPMSLAEVGVSLEDTVAGDPRTVLQLDAASGAEYQALASALAQARNSGVANISMRQR